MTLGFGLADRLISPERPRGIAIRYGAALILPLAAIASMHALFPGDESLFIPLLVLSIVSSALFGGVLAGILATVVSALADVLAMRSEPVLQTLDPEAWLHIAMFFLVGAFISFVAGSVGALARSVEVERRRLSVTLSCIGDAVITTDIDGQVLFMNPVAEKAIGWTSAEAYGKAPEKMFRILHQKLRTEVDNPMRQVLATGEVADLAVHTVLVRRDGTEIPISDSAAPIRDAQGRMIGTVMVFRDNTAETEREAAWLQTQRLASVGRLAATIAHEINNPLQSTSNFLYLISGGTDLEVVKGFAAAAAQELMRASEIANQALSFVRGAGERQSVPVSQLFGDVLSLYRNKLQNKNVDVFGDYSSQTFIEARAGEIRQVLGNLIGNALDALSKNGRLYLRARPRVFHGSAMICFVVADSGSGITKDDLARIFEPFFTTKKDVGTGLGLWVVKRIVEGEGGSLRIRSRFGRGTVARFCWPTATADLDSAEQIADPQSVSKFGPRKAVAEFNESGYLVSQASD